jgi:hypothetical protein
MSALADKGTSHNYVTQFLSKRSVHISKFMEISEIDDVKDDRQDRYYFQNSHKFVPARRAVKNINLKQQGACNDAAVIFRKP